MPTYAMVIDLQRCVGCGGCIFACKNENNLQEGVAWSNKINQTEGVFPNVRYTYIPTLCNHCENAPCVSGCPTRAMHKGEGGLTLHDTDKCIGCRYCMVRCPYGVIHFNWEEPHKFWRNEEAVIEGGTSTPRQVVLQVVANTIPYYNPDREKTYPGIRPKGVVEKCTMCDHRLINGELPYCVESCPANARVFGDLDDPNSEVNKLLGLYQPFRLREDLGTEPKIYYVRGFNPASNGNSKGSV